VWTVVDSKIEYIQIVTRNGEHSVDLEKTGDEATIFDVPLGSELSSCFVVLVGETKRYEFGTRPAAIAFALQSAQRLWKEDHSVSVNIEGADHVWRLFDPFMKPRT